MTRAWHTIRKVDQGFRVVRWEQREVDDGRAKLRRYTDDRLDWENTVERPVSNRWP